MAARSVARAIECGRHFCLSKHLSSRSRLSKGRVRGFCNAVSNTSNGTGTPMNQPLPGVPTPVYAVVSDHDNTHETHITTLDNGLRVASLNKFGHFCTVGVLLDSGSRYEVDYTKGISHFIQRTAFGSTENFESKDHILQVLEKYGGTCDCQTFRDFTAYGVSAETHGLSEVIEILADVVFKPKLTESELEDARTIMNFDLEDMDTSPEPYLMLEGMTHAAAYRHNTLGLPKFCPAENIPLIDKKTIFNYMHNYHTPERTILTGVGMEHDKLVEVAKKYFGNMKPSWEQPEVIAMGNRVDRSVAQYTGGIETLSKDMANIAPGTPLPELAHFVLGMESCGHQDPDFITVCVINMMMGGGNSFSAGGPGKGMYTRLYQDVLCQKHWMYSAVAVNHAYDDSGLFYIQASAPPAQVKQMVEVITKQFVNMKSAVNEVELSRAKRSLQSMLMMNLEERPIVMEDIGRQIIASGHRKTPEELLEEIAKITAEDVQRVTTRLLQSKPSVAALGNLSDLPSYEAIQAALLTKDGSFPKSFSQFMGKIKRKAKIFV